MTALESKLNYTFKNSSLLNVSLTHRSYSSTINNQRLEYLGDAVLDCIIASKLYDLYPKSREGLLSEYRSSLVNKVALAKIAREINLYDYMYFGQGEKRTNNKQDSILADAIEALIGAIFLDSDFEKCKVVVLDLFAKQLEGLSNSKKNSKSALQELCQSNGYNAPKYAVVKVSGLEHAQTFKVSCSISQKPHITYGSGKSKRQAEVEAALLMLQWIEKND